MSDVTGVKHDKGKLRYSLVDAAALAWIVGVLSFGAAKYAAENWRHVPDAERRYYDAILRHLEAWRSGEMNDEETGMPHLAHAGCCILFLLCIVHPSAEGVERLLAAAIKRVRAGRTL